MLPELVILWQDTTQDQTDPRIPELVLIWHFITPTFWCNKCWQCADNERSHIQHSPDLGPNDTLEPTYLYDLENRPNLKGSESLWVTLDRVLFNFCYVAFQTLFHPPPIYALCSFPDTTTLKEVHD